MTDWRDDEADEAEFDKGFFQFITDRKIKIYKRVEPHDEAESREIKPEN